MNTHNATRDTKSIEEPKIVEIIEEEEIEEEYEEEEIEEESGGEEEIEEESGGEEEEYEEEGEEEEYEEEGDEDGEEGDEEESGGEEYEEVEETSKPGIEIESMLSPEESQEDVMQKESVILNILKHLDLKEQCNLSQVNKAFYDGTRVNNTGKIVLKKGGFKYTTASGAILKVTEDGYFVEIRLGDLEFSFSKAIRCGDVTIYSEVWITERRGDVENKKEHLWKFPDLPRESLRETTDERLGNLYLRAERFIGKTYPWFIVNEPKTLTAMLELHSKIMNLIEAVETETEETETEESSDEIEKKEEED